MNTTIAGERVSVVMGLLLVCFLIALCTALISPLPLLAIVAIGLGTLVFLYPAYGLMAIIVFFLIQISPFYLEHAVFARSLTAADAVGVIAVAGWIRQEIRAGRRPVGAVLRRAGGEQRITAEMAAVLAVAAYSLWITISTLWSSAPLPFIYEFARPIIEGGFLFALMLVVFRSEVMARRAATVYVITAICLALYTIDHFRSLGGFGSGAGTILANTTYRGGLLDQSNQMSVILACAPGFAFIATARLKGLLRLALALAPVPFVVLAIAILASREAYVSLAVGVLASALIAGRFRYRLTAGVLLTLVGLGIFLAVNADSLPYWVTQRFTAADVATLGSRVPFWVVALHLFAQNPLGGLGLGGFEQIIPHYHVNPYLGVSATHNMYVHALVDTGIFGFIILLTMIATLGYVLLSTGRHPALIVNFLVIVVDMAAGDLLKAHFAWAVLGLVIAYALAAAREQPVVEPAKASDDREPRRAGTMLPVGPTPFPLSAQHRVP